MPRDWTITRIHNGERYSTRVHGATADEIWHMADALRRLHAGDVFTYHHTRKA